MSTRRILCFSGVFVGMVGLAAALPGCGGGGAQETLSTGEVKIAPTVNPKPGAVPVQEEYKNMDPSGKAR
jgi:hypothetical protein